MPILNKDMTMCISLSGRPSNNGTRFHNYLYDELGLNYFYKAFSTTNLEEAIAGVRGLGIRGCSVSMPFKEAIIPLLDVITDSASAIQSVNTVVNDGSSLTAYNTDYEAVAQLLAEHDVDTTSRVLVRGSGGMAKAVVAAFQGRGFGSLTVVARNETKGRALADQYGYRWVGGDEGTEFDVIVNVTPIGMAGGNDGSSEQLSFTPAQIDAASVVFDVVAFPSETPLIKAARARGTSVISGAEVIAIQAARQFKLYTGVELTPDQIARASAFARRI